MRRKKVKLVLLAAGVVVAAGVLFNTANVKALVSDNIKQDVVYTQEDSGEEVISDYTNLSAEEDAVIKEKSKEALEKYFSFLDGDFGKDLHYYSTLFSEKTIDGIINENLNTLNEVYNNGESNMSEEDYKKCKEEILQQKQGFMDSLSKVKHDYIMVVWYSSSSDRKYSVQLNADTKEVDQVGVSGNDYPGFEETNPSYEERQNIAKEYIKKYNLADMKSPKLIADRDDFLYFEDENDGNKKVLISVDRTNGVVYKFSLNNSIDFHGGLYVKAK